MKDKKTLITIIVLLVIFVPFAVFGTIEHIKNSDPSKAFEDSNLNQEFIHNNKVYLFLDGILLGTYDCTNCSKATTTIDDNIYHTNYYKDGKLEFDGVVSNTIALFSEGDKINYYLITNGTVVLKYDAIKNYNVLHTEPVLIAKLDGKWGVLNLTNYARILEYRYDYIAIPAHMKEGILDTSKYIAKENNNWYVITSDGTTLTNTVVEIVDFNSKYYITYNGTYHIYDYLNNEYLSDLSKNNVYGVDKYIIIEYGTTLLVYEDLNGAIVATATIKNYESIYFDSKDNQIDIYLDGDFYQTINI